MPRSLRPLFDAWRALGPARRAVLGVTLSVLTLLVAGTAMALHSERRLAVEAVQARDQQTALRLAASATEVLDQVEQSLRLLVYLAERGEHTSLHTLSRADLIATRTTRSILITDAAGTVVDSTSRDVPLNVADEDDFKQVKASAAERLLIGKPAQNPLTRLGSVTVWRRLAHADGRFAGAAAAEIDPAVLVASALRTQSARSVIGILGDDGLYRARFHGDEAVSVGDRLDVAGFLHRVEAARAEHEPLVSPLDGTARFGAAADMPRHGLIAVVATDAAAALAGYAETRGLMLRWATVLAATTLAAAWLLGATLGHLDASRRATRRADRDFRAAIEGSMDAVAILAAERGADGRIVDLVIQDINSRAAAMLGDTRAGLLGRHVSAVVPTMIEAGLLGAVARAIRDGRPIAAEIETTDARYSGRWMHHQIVPLDEGAALISRDVTESRDQARQLAALARFDSLTGLPNRRHFEEALVQARARSLRGGLPLALLYIDLDGFKAVNDTLGHEGGDLLLQGVALRLLESVRATDLVARLGGDEFTVLLEAAGTLGQVEEICGRVLEALSLPHSIDGHPVVATPSIGAVVLCDEESEESLRRRADLAMYDAKRAGKGRYRLVTEPVAHEDPVTV